MNLLALGIRNLARHRTRSLVTIGAMAFAGVIMIVYIGLMEGIFESSRRNAVDYDLGEFKINAPGYRKDPDLYKRIDNTQALLQPLQQAGYYASPRLYGFGLLALGYSSAGVQIRGVDIDSEKMVTKLHRHIAEGVWLSSGHNYGAVIGRKLARTLGARLGDKLVFVGQASDGSMANELFEVRGILKGVGEEIDRATLFLPAHTFRNLMVVPKGAHEIVVSRSSRQTDLDADTKKLAGLVGGNEIVSWKQVNPVLSNILDMAEGQNIFALIFTYLAVALVLLNAMLMSVFERMREFGIMRVLGFSPWRLWSLIYIEAMIQALAASVLSFVIGGLWLLRLEERGIDLGELAADAEWAGIAIDPVWRAVASWDGIIEPVGFLFFMAAIAVMYPAIKAALIRPLKAIYQV